MYVSFFENYKGNKMFDASIEYFIEACKRPVSAEYKRIVDSSDIDEKYRILNNLPVVTINGTYDSLYDSSLMENSGYIALHTIDGVGIKDKLHDIPFVYACLDTLVGTYLIIIKCDIDARTVMKPEYYNQIQSYLSVRGIYVNRHLTTETCSVSLTYDAEPYINKHAVSFKFDKV